MGDETQNPTATPAPATGTPISDSSTIGPDFSQVAGHVETKSAKAAAHNVEALDAESPSLQRVEALGRGAIDYGKSVLFPKGKTEKERITNIAKTTLQDPENEQTIKAGQDLNQADEESRTGHPVRAALSRVSAGGHALAGAIPMVGPIWSGVAEQTSTDVGTGNWQAVPGDIVAGKALMGAPEEGSSLLEKGAEHVVSKAGEVAKSALSAAGSEVGAAARAKAPEGSAEAGAIPLSPEDKLRAAKIPGHQVTKPNPKITTDGPAWERTSTATIEGRTAGKVGMKVDPSGRAQIFGSVVPEDLRGQGIGTGLYNKTIEEAHANPAVTHVTSDSTGHSPAADHVWQKIKAQGKYPVEEITHPNGKPGYQITFDRAGESNAPAAEEAKTAPKGNPQVAGSAQRYNAAHGQPEIDHAPAELPSQQERNDLADKFDRAKHEPNNPAVARSYNAMKKETLDQFNHAKNDLGIKFDFTDKDPYKNADEMQADVRNNHHLSVFTGEGGPVEGGGLPSDHPLKEVEPSTGQTYNNIFRATHDIYGHAASGNDFSEAGEHAAFGAHNQMYSPEARPAMQNETQGQSNWFFNNPEVRRGKALGDFPEQKATIIPEHERVTPKSASADIPESQQAATPKEDVLKKVAEKYGETEDPYKISHGASFITPEGKYIHLGGGIDHNRAIENVTGVMDGSKDNRPDFLNSTGAIRTRMTFGREGHTLHVSVPEKGITAEQVDALKAAAHQGLGGGKNGNIVMETATGGKSAEEQFANANNIEPMLKKIGVHPDGAEPQEWHQRAEEESKKNGGSFTIDPRTGSVPNSGHILEAVPEARQVSDKPNTAEEIKKYADKNAKLLKKHPDLMVGGYKNDAGKYELNLSAVTKDPEAAKTVAGKLDQESVWNAGEQKLVPTGGKNLQTEFKDYSIGQRLRDLAPKEPGNTISTRYPTAVASTEDPLRHTMTVGDKAILDRNPGLADKYAAAIREYPGVKIPPGADSKQTIAAFQDHVKDNLKWLYNQSTPDEQNANKGWYDGAHALSKEIADQHGYSHPQIAGVIAAMSPQKDWDMNVSLAKRLTDIVKNQQETKTTPEMIQKGKDIVAETQAINPKANTALQGTIKKLKGKTLGELKDPTEKAFWVRLYDEAHNPRTFEKIGPDGKVAGMRTNADGSPSQVAWGGSNEINKAISILSDGSRENISKTLATGAHKMRSFYNNIIEPNSLKGDVTVDTHAVAAGLMRPLGGFDREVYHNFNSPSSSVEGLHGTYPLYHSAYTQAAKELDIEHPRQLQSVAWEKIRNLFPAEFKTPENKAAIDSIWKEHQDGQITADEARQRILDYAKSHAGVSEGAQPAPDQGQLPLRGVHGEAAEGTGRGTGSSDSVGNKASGPTKQNDPVGFISPDGQFEKFNQLKGKDIGHEATHDDFASNRGLSHAEMLKEGWVRKAGQGSYQTGKLTPQTSKAIEKDIISDYGDMVRPGMQGHRVESIVIDTDSGTHEFTPEDFVEKYNGDLSRAIRPQQPAQTDKPAGRDWSKVLQESDTAAKRRKENKKVRPLI